MGRRRLVALVSALVMLVIFAGVITGFVVATQSDRGRDLIRRLAQAQLSRSVRGTFHLGTLSGSFLTDLTADSVEIRDPGDSVFFASGPVRITYDPRDLIDGRLILRSVDVERPVAYMRRDFQDRWTKDLIWPRSGRVRVPGSRSGFGAMVVFEQVRVHDGEFVLQLPWNPPDSLRGARRDSAVAVALALGRPEVRRVPGRGYVRTWRWRAIQAELPRMRLAYPDSAGRRFDVARLDVSETDPPFDFHGIRGEARWLGDSVWFEFPDFALPRSVGHAEGKIWWGSGQPIRPRVRIRGDSVALADVAWLSASLPTTGGGSVVLDITTAPNVPNGLSYALTDLDVRSHASHIRGKMTWVVGGPVLAVEDVDLEGTPVDFALLERFNTMPFPLPYRGTIAGRVRGPGGPLNRFMVDSAIATFRDANIPGAITRGHGRGMLDILYPSRTVFRGFDLVLDEMDLRTPQFLDPDFPRVNGTLSGSARLDSSWLDVRITEGDFTHRDGDAPESRFRGSGRLTDGLVEMSYEMAAVATPLSFTALARSYPVVKLRGEFTGPIRARGSLSDLTVGGDLVGPAGRMEGDLRVDAVPPGYRLAGRLNLTAFDPRVALDNARAPGGELTAQAVLDVTGDSLANLAGTAQFGLDRSTLDGIRVFVGDIGLRFADGLAHLDSLHLETSALEIDGAGALGLHVGVRDSLRLRMTVDSLGGFRRWLARSETDSLAGQFTLEATLDGRVRDFGLRAALDGTGLLARGMSAERVAGTADLRSLPSAPRGRAELQIDTARVIGLGIARSVAQLDLDGEQSASVSMQTTGLRGTTTRSLARLSRDSSGLAIRLDSLAVTTELQRWTLAGPASFLRGPAGFAVDSFVLQGRPGSLVRVAGAAPSSGPMALTAAARAVPVSDIAELLQLSNVGDGRLDLDARLTGTRAAPALALDAALTGALVRGIRVDSLRARATAASDALRFTADLGARATPSLHAEGTLPVRLGLDAGGPSVASDGAVSVRVRSDSVGLRLFEQYVVRSDGDPGNFALNVDVSGTWAHPLFDGGLLVRNGDLALAPLGDVRWRNVQADLGFLRDSIAVRTLTATSTSPGRTGRASATGWMRIADRENPAFDLRLALREFHIYNQRDAADLDVSDSLRLTGSLRGATLTGALTVDRGVIAIPELASKNVIALEEFDRFGLVDTASLIDRRLVPRRPSLLEENLTVRNVPVRMGRDVWLRSEEANINLGGAISITVNQDIRARDTQRAQLALTGSLETVRGTYRLNLGPVQRSFGVETGAIQFFGEPELNPTLDISALYTVRQYSQQGARPDVRVRAHLGGTLLAPTLELSTPDSLRVTNADLISYLVTGGPSFAIGDRDADYTSTAARVVISSIGSVFGGKAAGGVCDDAQLSTAGLEGYRGRLGDVSGRVLSGTRFNCAKQLSDKTFVRLDAGLCQVGQIVAGGNGNVANFADNIGVKLDYLLRPDLTASIGVEPPTSAILCAQNIGASARGFAPTPRQFGFDLFRVWRF
ncbi:MAG: translocation/assembly module TamB [Gemmatimonadota bacterium]|nr:translocation/assembly module TamB [Gemmatimonadota bacterium]